MTQQPQSFTLLEATRIVARGSELDAKLEALCEHVLTVADASAAVIYLFNPVTVQLVPAAQAGLDGASLEAADMVSGDDPEELVARVARERQVLAGSGQESRLAAGMSPVALSIVGLPLVSSDTAGGEDIEGVLLAAFPSPTPHGSDDTLAALADLIAVAIHQARLQSALQERSEWIGRLASTDPLTGIANRITFEQMLELEIARATRQETQVSVVLFDIDGFADFNEAAGAQAADDVLRIVAATLADQVRLVDTVARFGPDEFALIAPGGGGEVAAKRVQTALAQRQVAGQPISVRVGAVVYPRDGASTEELLAAADGALTEAKRRGRGSIVAGQRT